MGVGVGLIITIGIIIWLQVTLRLSGKQLFRKDKFKLEDYLEEERKANFSRRRDVDDKYFIVPDTSRLPCKDYNSMDSLGPDDARMAEKQARVLKKAGLKMIRFDSDYSNRELKIKYGNAGLGDIIMYEDNLQQYIMALLEWAEALMAAGEYDRTQTVLEHSIEIGSDISKSYTYLADIYAMNADKQRIHALLEKLSNGEYMVRNDIIRNKIIRYLTGCLD